MSHERFRTTIDACTNCAQWCEHSVAACLGEAELARCTDVIRLCRDCAETCWGAASFCCRDSRFAEDFCLLCADVCDACGLECRKHDQDYCQQCADACDRCADECRRMAGVAAQ